MKTNLMKEKKIKKQKNLLYFWLKGSLLISQISLCLTLFLWLLWEQLQKGRVAPLAYGIAGALGEGSLDSMIGTLQENSIKEVCSLTCFWSLRSL
jgi:hypothetical protein